MAHAVFGRGLVVSLLLLGCKLEKNSTTAPPIVVKGECDDVDDTRLEQVIECIYHAKRSGSLWRFFSAAAQAETSRAELEKDDRSQFEFSDARITKQDSVGGSAYAAVSRTRRSKQPDGGMSCSQTQTVTWIKEGSSWRILGGYDKIAELTGKKFSSGDYSGAAASAEEWLTIDPLSMDAYQQLGFSVERGAKGKSTSDVVRAVLGIDAKNSTALFLAVSLTGDPDVCENYLRQFKPDDCNLMSAVENVANAQLGAGRPRDALAMIDKWASLDAFPLQRIKALNKLGRSKEVPALLTTVVAEGIKRKLEQQDASYSASWASVVAGALIDGGQKEKAREWIDYGLLKDPSDASLAKLLRVLKK